MIFLCHLGSIVLSANRLEIGIPKLLACLVLKWNLKVPLPKIKTSRHGNKVKLTLPETKPASLHLKMDGWFMAVGIKPMKCPWFLQFSAGLGKCLFRRCFFHPWYVAGRSGNWNGTAAATGAVLFWYYNKSFHMGVSKIGGFPQNGWFTKGKAY